ncbi:membrane associated rhomboid family serine protease [Thermocatellispora tengchongensis]|uniref:Membrane associated rhomboid family serine protease n=1 Tax=Thermocatellispora tengchongensis TaxID=1073253 RepID=A0A840PIB2_9ACTN|nr:rhomboid family intramembrane serine protease [Thermocatellispora tengchongensis]MBB5138719.1 membrane associated rhomboid family serine protease [Thermocatellispora tengchongensis]
MSDYPTGYHSPDPSRSQQWKTRGLGVLTGALGAAVIMVVMLAAMWLLEFIDYGLGGALDYYGIIAHNPDHLSGILFAPFLHAGFGHLMANSLPLLILGFLAAFRGLGRFAAASLIIILVSGVGVWLFTAAGYITVGASGLVFGYFGFVVARGLFDRRVLDIAVGVGVAITYYSLLEGLLPNQPGISWQGHLFGLIGGVVAAWVLRRKRPEVTRRPSPYSLDY